MGEVADILSRMDLGQARLQQLLLPDERVIWTGRPDPRAHFTPADFWLVPFSLMWAGFAVFWEFTAVSMGRGSFALVGIPFVLIGLYFVVGRFFYKSFTKNGTVYALTDRRAIVLNRGTSLDEMAIGSAKAAISTSQFANHMSVRFGTQVASLFAQNSMNELYANTGMDFFVRSSGRIRFFDVEDVAGLSAALNEFRLVKNL